MKVSRAPEENRSRLVDLLVVGATSPEAFLVASTQDQRDECPRMIMRVLLFVATADLMHVEAAPLGLPDSPTPEVNGPLLGDDLLHKLQDPHGSFFLKRSIKACVGGGGFFKASMNRS